MNNQTSYKPIKPKKPREKKVKDPNAVKKPTKKADPRPAPTPLPVQDLVVLGTVPFSGNKMTQNLCVNYLPLLLLSPTVRSSNQFPD